jgi:hypothetical protein
LEPLVIAGMCPSGYWCVRRVTWHAAAHCLLVLQADACASCQRSH